MPTSEEYWSDPRAFEDLTRQQFLALVLKKEGEEAFRQVLAVEHENPLHGTTRESLEDLAWEFSVLKLKKAARIVLEVSRTKPDELDLRFCCYSYPPYIGGHLHQNNISAWLAEQKRRLARRRQELAKRLKRPLSELENLVASQDNN